MRMDADQIRYGQTASEQDRQNLVEFLRYVHDLLQFIVDWRSVFLPRDYQRTIEAAWEEVRPVFADMQREILRGQHDEGLRDVGLTGAQLAFKLAAFNLARRKL